MRCSRGRAEIRAGCVLAVWSAGAVRGVQDGSVLAFAHALQKPVVKIEAERLVEPIVATGVVRKRTRPDGCILKLWHRGKRAREP